MELISLPSRVAYDGGVSSVGVECNDLRAASGARPGAPPGAHLQGSGSYALHSKQIMAQGNRKPETNISHQTPFHPVAETQTNDSAPA